MLVFFLDESVVLGAEYDGGGYGLGFPVGHSLVNLAFSFPCLLQLVPFLFRKAGTLQQYNYPSVLLYFHQQLTLVFYGSIIGAGSLKCSMALISLLLHENL